MTMLVAVIGHDKPDHLDTRMKTRAAHLAYIEATGIVRMAGPLIEGGQMCGSVIVPETDGLERAQDWVRGDPHVLAGLFDRVTMTEWKKVIG
jgi:uncharacterized protein